MKKNYSHYIAFCLILSLAGVLTACNGETKSAETVSQTASQPSITQRAPDAKLNMNSASEEAFRTIPGVGDKMVHEFKEYRPYVSIREFRKEIGKYVDEQQVAEYEQYIFVPISFNESDAATLQQIPGLETAEAEALTQKRPYENKQAFLDALSSYINEQQTKVAKSYLKTDE